MRACFRALTLTGVAIAWAQSAGAQAPAAPPAAPPPASQPAPPVPVQQVQPVPLPPTSTSPAPTQPQIIYVDPATGRQVSPPPQVVYVPQPATPPAPAAPARPQLVEVKRWYGWQTLIIDGAVLATYITGVATQGGTPVTLSALGYLFGPPIVHMANGNIGPGFGSFGVRLLTIPITVLIGGLVGGVAGAGGATAESYLGNVQEGVAYGVTIGAFAGFALTVALDAAVFGYKKEKVDPSELQNEAKVRRPKPFMVVPRLSLDPQNPFVGVGGVF